MRKIKPWKFQDNDAPNEPQQTVITDYKEPSYIEITNNKVYFYSDIDRDKLLVLVKVLKDREDEMIFRKITWNLNETPTIHLHIQSYGGLAHAGFGGYDHIRSLKIPIYTYIDGVAASAATLLSIGGTKRFIYRNSFMLIHSARQEYWGSYTYDELTEAKENMDYLMKALKRVYLERTKIPEKKLNKLLQNDLYFNADEALEYGLVDEIIET